MGKTRLERNKMNDFIKLVPPFTFPQWGLVIHAYRLLAGRKCPLNYYKFGEYSPQLWACSPFGGPAWLG
jgi:hypothetical protein